jgi:hypothetical protein
MSHESAIRLPNPLPRVLLLLCLAGGAFYFFKHFEIHGLDQVSVHSKSASSDEMQVPFSAGDGSVTAARWRSSEANSFALTPVAASSAAPVPLDDVPNLPVANPAGRYLRIGTWALGGFGPDKIQAPESFDRVAAVIQGYDILAVQQLRATQRDFVPQLAARASVGGRRFDFLLGPVHEPSGEQLAFFFDTNRIVTDRTQLYSVADPDQRMTHDPLVGWFRAAEPPPEIAWTFSIVNVRIELPLARQETAELPRILAAVTRDGRGEDDCLLIGLFQADDVYVTATLRQPALRAAIKGTPTDIFARHQTSNVIYHNTLTSEAIGRAGVYDFLRRENLSLADAEQVSPYLPVWAEFSPREGGELVDAGVN